VRTFRRPSATGLFRVAGRDGAVARCTSDPSLGAVSRAAGPIGAVRHGAGPLLAVGATVSVSVANNPQSLRLAKIYMISILGEIMAREAQTPRARESAACGGRLGFGGSASQSAIPLAGAVVNRAVTGEAWVRSSFP
jgi:hypothetical protein